MSSFALRLTMLSDWRVGTGTGRHGQVDRLIARDRDGLAYVPAKTLLGVWRDSCEVAATALDTTTPGLWHAWVEYLFGSQPTVAGSRDGRAPRPGAMSVSDARLPAAVIDTLVGRPALREAVTFLKPSIAIDAASGQVMDRALRFDEMARCGAVLVASGELAHHDQLDTDQRRCAATLLAAGAQLLERLGGGRRRGAGRCRLTVDGLADDLEWVRTATHVPGPPGATSTHLDEHLPQAYDWSSYERVALRLELLAPVVVGERTVGNLVQSADRIPGSLLLPPVLQMIGQDAAHVAARGGGIVVTDATIDVAGAPGRRAPAVVVRDRHEPRQWYNTLVESLPEAAHPEPVPGYVGGPDSPVAARCPMREYTHNSIDDDVQRPTEELGGLYTYEAIAPGTVMWAEVRVAAGVLPDGWQARLRGVLRLGRARRAGYGRVAVQMADAPPATPRTSPSRRLTVWLLSDLLLQDARLRPTADDREIATALGHALAVTLRPAGHLAGRFPAVHRHESWQVRWGLPRPTLCAVAAGTCLVFDVVDGALDPDRMTRVEVEGIGIRRGEGFGQVRLNDALLAATFASRTASTARGDARTPTQAGSLTTSDRQMLGAVERAAWMTAIGESCETLASTQAGRADVLGDGIRQVPMTQLASVRRIAAEPDDTAVRSWLASLTATQLRQRAWPATVRERLAQLLREPEAVWRQLALDEDALSTHAEAAQQMRARLWLTARSVLLTECISAETRARQAEDTV